jgi:hypothetical protein
MAPAEKPHLPFRWSFIPQQNPRDGTIRWTWRAHTQVGDVAMESEGSFETFTECLNDAKSKGYGER